MKNKCTAIRNDGNPCRSWAVRDSDPPRCAAHGGGPKRSASALGHSPRRPLNTADDTMAHMAESLEQTADFINQHADELTPDEMARLQGVRGQNLARFARMQRDKARSAAGSGDPADSIFDRALQKAAETLGVDLSAP